MRATQRVILAAILVANTVACGSSSTTSVGGTTSGNTGSGKTMTATYNGTDYKPTLLTAVYLNGTLAVNASDGPRQFSINALNVASPGTVSLASGNPNSALVQWLDGSATYVSGAQGGSATFTVLQLGRVAGSFNVILRGTPAGGATTNLTLVGSFDIKFP